MSQQGADLDDRSPEEIALASLAHARSYAGNVARVTDRVAALLREARIEEGNELFAQVLDALNVLVFTIDRSAGLIDSNGAAPYPNAGADCAGWVPLLMDAQESQDWVRVADVLEYDVRPGVEAWSQALGSIPGVAGR